jgi:hypothetical protein
MLTVGFLAVTVVLCVGTWQRLKLLAGVDPWLQSSLGWNVKVGWEAKTATWAVVGLATLALAIIVGADPLLSPCPPLLVGRVGVTYPLACCPERR